MDIADPLNPTEAATYGFVGAAADIVIGGNYAYLATESMPTDTVHTVLRVIDISNPLTPMEVGSYAAGRYGTSVSLYGSYLYLNTLFGGLHVFDVTDPTNPVETGLYTGATIGRVAAVPPFFYAAAGLHAGFEILQLDIPSSIPEPAASGLALYQNYPNPFNPMTTISFVLPRPMAVELAIYDVKGKLVATIIDEFTSGGPNSTTW
ncbi:MAG: hypothetical protein IH973_08410, partial [Myxococcales bacterium]|nr:hypothetical protein [Myxococcales bacterium]